MGSAVLPHLVTGWHVDQAIVSEDEVLYRIADRVKNFAVIYVCGLDQVKDFNQMYAVRPHDAHVLLQ
jgi:DIM1 family U5 snRNP protein